MKRFFTVFFLFLLFCTNTKALFYPGAESYEVRELQQSLYRAGYYGGEWNGKYTEQVCEAVKAYQRDCGIYPDGICTYALAYSLNADIKYNKNDEDAVKLARLLCRVCKNGDRLTKAAVASVALNRLESPLFPDDIPSVINTLGGAFPCDIPEDCMRAAYEAIQGVKPYGGILYFEDAGKADKSVKGAKHGGFVFYK